MSTRQALATTGDIALELLRLTAATADDVTARIIQSLAHTEVSQIDLKDKLVRLSTAIYQIVTRIQSEQARSKLSRFSRFMGDPDLITEMRKEIDDAVGLFELEAIALTEINVQTTLDAVILNSKELSRIAVKVGSISRKASLIAQNATLDKLRYVHGASWDPYRVCLRNTRVDIIDDALLWVYQSNDRQEAQILLLTAVAGAGKSTVAHTFAQRCAEKGLLVSSFFFDREIAGRNSPAGLSKVSKQLAVRISSAIDNDQDLPRAPISRQFEELVMGPALECTLKGPLVIVIDALDEGWSRDLLTILKNRLPRLPDAFRVFITSRVRPELEDLRQERHVTSLNLDVTSQSNMEDIALFIPHKLKELARIRRLGDDWPNEQLRRQFEARAEGLFLWATTLCEYLQKEPYPTRKLENLVSGPGKATRSAETQMDKLYAAILHSCDWDNEDFVSEYQRIVGAMITTKTPLNVTTLNALFHEEQTISSYVLQQLSPVLTGTSEEDFDSQPLRVLHQSFRDFLVLRAATSDEYHKFQVIEKHHSQRFALLCLETMNRDLNESIAGEKYLADESLGNPSVYDRQIPEALWYACQFWIDHLLDGGPSDSIAIGTALQQFINNKAVLWIQLMTLKSQFRGLTEVRRWCNENISSKNIVDWKMSAADYASTCGSLGIRLGFENRRGESLSATQESVQIYRQLIIEQPVIFTPDLAGSLISLSKCLPALGRREEALAAIQESVALHRQLAADQPSAFNSDLARSLNNLSVRLASVGRDDEALTAIKDSLEIYQQLAADRSVVFNPDIARSLSNLSNRLSDLGRHEEALTAIQDSLVLHRQLATDRPSAFSTDLATSLNNLSQRLFDLGRREEALIATQESVALRQQLATDRPAAFSPDLAWSLNNLSIRLSGMGRREEALKAIQESLELYRQLVTDQPIVFNPNLAKSLNHLSNCLSVLGRREEALTAIQESVALCQKLSIDRPAAFKSDLARSLNNLSQWLSELGRREEALTAIRESVVLRRQLATDRPAAFKSDLARCLKTLSQCLSDLGRHEEALIEIQASAELYRQLATDRPAVFTLELAISLNELLSSFSKLGRREKALKSMQELVTVHRQLAADKPAAFNSDLAQSLKNLSHYFSDLDRHEEALAAIQESLEIYRHLAEDSPVKFTPRISQSLKHLSECLKILGRLEEAASVVEEANIINS